MASAVDLLGLEEPVGVPNGVTNLKAFGDQQALVEAEKSNGPSLPTTEPTSNEIHDPTTGELIDRQDIDSLIDALERIEADDARLYAAKCEIRKALAAMTEGNAKTRRVQGHRRKAKVEMPSDSWDRKALRQAWDTWPDLRDQALRIGSIEIKAVEYKKLINTSGPPELEAFRNALTQANLGPQGLPSVKIEV